MKLEVLVATMNQADWSLPGRMNLKTDAVIANQCGRWEFETRATPDGTVKRISSDTIGVGINRNLALQNAEGDILLFADDDLTYYDGTLQGVADAFRELPDADVIVFGIDMTRNGEVFDKRRNKIQRIHLWNALRYGAARTAIRREAVERGRLSFSTLFGGGCRYSSGEDTLFLVDCFRAGLKVYSHSYVLGACAKDTSTWFTGFNEKFLFDKGAWIACAFPRVKHLIKWHFIRRYRKKTNLPLKKVIKCMNSGIRAFRELKNFEDISPDI